MKASEFDEKFDSDEDVIDELEFEKAKRPMRKQKRVNVDFPEWMLESLDEEAARIGVTRQSIIKVWLAERLEQIEKHNIGKQV
ncbi:CopG family transcriptional regulator [Idiomarina sp. X4]|jgi:predicted DNA binding CopG/RHH family protein|uniref:type II toxin-antitoxin system BrnA family antitoxin n=1 Tax=Idiomarina sp. X4 TaxID=2055892 RepID=UPI000C281DBD|nr:CopG family transcriptional regulator [Idiomarina sp. X4]ATZ72680.1 CopG family transcriptional regulator [Idiomarina sp. X4]